MLRVAPNQKALQDLISALQSQVTAITVPDISGLATKSALSTVEAKIPSITGLATTTSVSSLSTRIDNLSIPDVSGLATKSALSSVEAKIPSITGLATQSALSTVEAKIPSITGLATQASLDALAAKTAVVLDGSFTVDTLPTPSAQYLDKYARVTDLFGAKRDLVLCSMVDSTYFWQPVRKEYAKTLALTTDVTLTTLKSPTIILAAGTLLANRTINLSNTYAYPGASFEVGFDGNLGLFGITIKNALGATLGSLLAGGRKRYFFADGAWQNF